MIRYVLAAALIFIQVAQAQPIPPPSVPTSAIGVAGGVAPLDALGKAPLSKTHTEDDKLHAVCQTYGFGNLAGTLTNGTTAFGETDRYACTTKGPISQVRLFLPAKGDINGQEINGPNTVFHIASVEYGANTTPPLFTISGQTLMPVDPSGSGVLTDPVGIAIPAGSIFYIRYGTYLAWPPASLTATAATGGALTTGTYYYKATCLKSGVESGPTSEASVAISGSTLSASLAWTATLSPIGCDSVKVYRSTTSGTEAYLATIPGPGLTYLDTGTGSTVSGATPPAMGKYPINDYLLSGNSVSAPTCQSGSGANFTVGTGTFGTAGPLVCTVAEPATIIADDTTNQTICGMGDSIEAGTGMQSGTLYFAGSATQANWFVSGLAGYNVLNLSIPGSKASSFAATNFYGASQRLRELDYCSIVVSDLVTNDLYLGSYTWQSVAGAHIQIGQALAQRGKRYFITTALPRVTSSDNMITLSGQTLASAETARDNYNLWVRGGMQVSGGAPVLTGGTATPYINGYFDLAGAMGEINSSGAVTQNGGYWPAATTAYSAQAMTGTETSTVLNVSSAAYTLHALAGDVVKVTSGVANNQTCIVIDNTATSVTCSSLTALTTIPAAGDTFSLYVTNSPDGTHPSYYMHHQIGAAFTTWAAANLGAF